MYKGFYISKSDDERDGLYHFEVLPENDQWQMDTAYAPGRNHKKFPNRYKVVDGKLYLWNDKNQTITQEIIDTMYKYKVLDSFSLKMEMGLIDSKLTESDYPVEVYDDALESANYFICKDDLRKFKVIYSAYPIPKDKSPQLNCK